MCRPCNIVDRVRHAVDGSDLFVGLVSTHLRLFHRYHRMHARLARARVRESVGRETTRAVVKGIFLVIVLDALFSILFEKLGL